MEEREGKSGRGVFIFRDPRRLKMGNRTRIGHSRANPIRHGRHPEPQGEQPKQRAYLQAPASAEGSDNHEKLHVIHQRNHRAPFEWVQALRSERADPSDKPDRGRQRPRSSTRTLPVRVPVQINADCSPNQQHTFNCLCHTITPHEAQETMSVETTASTAFSRRNWRRMARCDPAC